MIVVSDISVVFVSKDSMSRVIAGEKRFEEMKSWKMEKREVIASNRGSSASKSAKVSTLYCLPV